MMEFGKYSPLKVKCDDERVGFKHLTMFSKGEKAVLKYFFQHYDTLKISNKTKVLLQRMDAYLDIPLVQAVLRFDYQSLKRLILNECTIIPHKSHRIDLSLLYHSIQDRDVESFPVFVYIIDHNKNLNADYLISHAAEYGRIDIMKYLLNLGGKITMASVEYAVKNGDLDCIKFIHESSLLWCDRYTQMVIECGYVEILKYLLDNGIHDSQQYINNLLASNKFIVTLREHVNLEVNGVRVKHVEMLKYLYSKGLQLDSHMITIAIEEENMEALQFLCENKCPIPAKVLTLAVISGSLDIVNLLLGYTNPIQESQESVVYEAVYHGHLHILKHLCQLWGINVVQKDCVNIAIEKGYLECLQYLLGIKYSYLCKELLDMAIEHGHFDCYAFLIDSLL